MNTSTAWRLLACLQDGKFHSGQTLATTMELSRTAVWKQIRYLQGLGLEIQALKGRGYRLTRPLELLDRGRIEQSLQAKGMTAVPLTIHCQLPSTNTHLLETAQAQPTGSVCLAEMQTAGKGRMGRRWVSPLGSNLCLSILWRFSSPEALGGLSLAVGVAVVRALSNIGFPPLALKWPNDVLWQGRKLGGILVEATGEAQGGCTAVVGLGLNLFIPKCAATQIDQPWVDAETLLPGNVPSRNHLAAGLIWRLSSLLQDYENRGLEPWLEDWRRCNCVLGRKVSISQGDRQFAATAMDVAANGALIVQLANGQKQTLLAGDIQLRTQET